MTGMLAKPIPARSFMLVIFALAVWISTNLSGGIKDSDATFPLNEGTFWIYRGFIRWTHDINRVSKIPVTWRMEVRKLISRGSLRVAVINGFPSDLDWSNGHPIPTDTLIIQSAANKFYLTSASNGEADVLKRAQDSSDSLDGLLSDHDLFLELPLEKGKKFCDADGMARPDTHYCWVVDSVAPAVLDTIKGTSSEQRKAYGIQFVTLPETIAFTFVPGVGFTTYQYHHHGTVADTELKLVEFHLGDGAPNSFSRAHP
jgi:hypothetical protein